MISMSRTHDMFKSSFTSVTLVRFRVIYIYLAIILRADIVHYETPKIANKVPEITQSCNENNTCIEEFKSCLLG